MGGYAVLGWGSLIWDLEILSAEVEGDWQMRAGPALAMEFSRVSPKRKRALAVCLDPAHGTPCPTHAIASRRDAIAPVIGDLAARERAPLNRIGAVCLASGHTQGAQEEVIQAVGDWCRAAGWSGAVWTDLPSNFREELGRHFSPERGLAYLKELAGESLEEAVRYIEMAPPETDTALRRLLRADPWWQEQADRFRGALRR